MNGIDTDDLVAGDVLLHNDPRGGRLHTSGQAAVHCCDKGYGNGVIARAIQDSICFCPPLTIAAPQADDMADRFARCPEPATASVEAGMPAA